MIHQSQDPPCLTSNDLDLIAFDFDGVLTDNRVFVFESGLEAVQCSRADGLGFDLLRTSSISTVIISSESNSVVSSRANKLNVPVLQGISNKDATLQQYCFARSIKLNRVAFVGNDLNDIPAMKIVGFPIAVADAALEVREIANIILRTSGGDGVVREIAHTLLGLDF